MQDFDTTNNISLFFADPTPFLKALVQSVTTFVQENTGACNVTVDILGTMFKVCLKLSVLEPSDMPENTDFKLDAVNKLFLIRVMVGLVILYDHVNDPNGAFGKGKAKKYFLSCSPDPATNSKIPNFENKFYTSFSSYYL